MIYKRARYSVENLIVKLKECIGKPKDLWKAIKSLGQPNKSGGCIVGALAENQIVKHDTKSVLKALKCFHSNLAEDILAKLSRSPNRYSIKLVSDYEKLSLSGNFELVSITEGYMFNILTNIEVTKAAGIEKNPGKFLKNGARI